MKQMLLLLISIFTCATAVSQKLHLDDLQTTLDSITGNLLQDDEPGLSVGVLYQGKPILNWHHGLMNLDYGMKTSGRTAYNLASVSKHITAFGILLLEAEGKLKLQDELGHYLPNLPQEYQKLTLNQLLHHTSGVPSTDNLLLFAGISLDTPWTMEEEMTLLKNYSQLNFEPGTEYMYSNGGYSLLAAVIEAASEEDFEDFFSLRVFEPLEIQAKVKNSNGKIIKNCARGYKEIGESFSEVYSESVPGASNFYFSMKDMLSWMKLLLQENKKYSSQISKMMKPSFVLSTGDTLPYSFGLNVREYKGIKRVYHSGGTRGFASYMLLFPEHDLGITILTNNEQLNVAPLIYQLAENVLTEFLVEKIPVERTAIVIPEEDLQKWAGSYRMKDGMILQMVIDKNKLFLELPQDQRFQLHPETHTDFFIREFDAQIEFSENYEGKPFQFKLIQGKNIQPGDYIDSKETFQAPPAPEMVVGSYYQKELEVTYTLEEKEGKLFLQLPKTFEKYLDFNNVSLKPMAGDVFNSDRLGVVEFLRNEQEQISGFKFNDVGRLRNIRFVKTR